MIKSKHFFIAFGLFIISNFIGIAIYSLLYTSNYTNNQMPRMELTYEKFIEYLIVILPNNLMVIGLYIFILPLLWLLKDKVFKTGYTKIDIIIYHIVNSIIIVNTGWQLGYLMQSVNYTFEYSLWQLYLLGILPHGIIELSAFFIIFAINISLINNKKNKNKFYINYKLYLIPVLFIFIASLLESSITPILLYNMILFK